MSNDYESKIGPKILIHFDPRIKWLTHRSASSTLSTNLLIFKTSDHPNKKKTPAPPLVLHTLQPISHHVITREIIVSLTGVALTYWLVPIRCCRTV